MSRRASRRTVVDMSATDGSWPGPRAFVGDESAPPTLITTEGPGAQDDGASEGRTYTRSTIPFPYADLGDALRIAQVIHREYGDRCSADQLAASLGQRTQSGSFRSKVSATQLFGIITNDRGRLVLTPRGRRVVDDQTQRHALVEAFLAVDLYRAIFEKYQGGLLPADRGLQQEMIGLGVAPKQAERARQAFQRTADIAGFFRLGRERLVAPPDAEIGGNISDMPAAPVAVTPDPPLSAPAPVPSHRLHPLLDGLMGELPANGERFPAEKRKDWLDAAQVIFRLVYGKDDNDRKERGGTEDAQVRGGGPDYAGRGAHSGA